MKKILIVLSLTLSSLSFAQTDYTFCNKYIDDNNLNFQKTNFGNYFPFKIDEKTGAVITTNSQLDSKKNEKSVEYSLIAPTGNAKITAFVDDSGKISKVETFRSGQNFSAKTSVEFNIDGGKCYPKISYSDYSSNGQKVRATTFDTVLCKRIQDYFESNSALAKCLSPDSKENQDMNNIFKKHGYDNEALLKDHGPSVTPSFLTRMNYTVEQKIIVGNPELVNSGDAKKNNRGLAISGGTPVMSGFMILNDCYDKGLFGVLHDDKMFKTAGGTSNAGTGATGIPE